MEKFDLIVRYRNSFFEEVSIIIIETEEGIELDFCSTKLKKSIK